MQKKTKEGDGIGIWVTYLIMGLSIDKQKLPVPNTTHIAPRLQLPVPMNIGKGLLVSIFPLGQLFGLIPIHRDSPPLRVASYVCVLNQPVKAERMLYKRWKPFGGSKTKAEAERTEPRNHYYQQRDWPSADDFQE